LPARQAQVGQQAKLLAPRQHLGAEAGGNAEQPDADGHGLQPVGDGESCGRKCAERAHRLGRW
jgi:hypothetical protein